MTKDSSFGVQTRAFYEKPALMDAGSFAVETRGRRSYNWERTGRRDDPVPSPWPRR